MSFTYRYPRPAITVDCVILGKENQHHFVLLIQRKNPPYQGCWALPGGFLDVGESPASAATRELKEETGLTGIPLTQLHTFGEPNRDPREHVITIAHCAEVEKSEHTPIAADDATNVNWFSIHQLPTLAFDHHKIIQMAVKSIHQTPKRNHPS